MRKLSNLDIRSSNLYRIKKYRSRINILIALLLLALIQFFALLLIVGSHKEPTYYATNSESELYKMQVYDQPNYKDKAILQDDLPPYSQIKKLVLP